MKTVPFWASPLQNCAGCVLLLTQSGCMRARQPGGSHDYRGGGRMRRKDRTLMPQRNGATPVPTTASWLSARSSVFLRIARSASLIVESCSARVAVRANASG